MPDQNTFHAKTPSRQDAKKNSIWLPVPFLGVLATWRLGVQRAWVARVLGCTLVLAVSFGHAAAVFALERTFQLDPTGWHEVPKSVTVAGPFNGWNKTAHPMTRNSDGVYTALVDLDEGIHLYKFVINGEDWVNDKVHSDPELEEPDGHGGMNSAVFIGQDARDLPAPQPNHIRVEAISHNPDDFTHRSVVNENLLLLGVTTQANDVQHASVWLVERHRGRKVSHHALTLEKTELGQDHFIGLIPTKGELVNYWIFLTDGDETIQIGRNEVNSNQDLTDSKIAFSIDMTPTFQTPDWAKHAVWYQIFPERFRNGDPSNDPGDEPYETLLPWTIDWWKTYTKYGEAPGKNNFYEGEGNVWKRRFGGDLQGVQEALPYLRRLGINALYFNPVFEADSMHKYDASDYRHIDDNFGVKSKTPRNQVKGETDDPSTWGWSESDQVFLEFIEEAHAQGFKVVIDGVFNHVGKSHPFFQDVLKNGEKSRYAEWFEITGTNPDLRSADNPHGIEYVAWDGPNGHLPVFKNDPATGLADAPRKHIFDITKRWMDPNGDGDPSDGIDGWRLDVPGDIAHPFWIEWRTLVKGINPDAYISGEIWSWAHPWLKGDQFDAVMNYQYAMPAIDFFADDNDAITPSEFAQRLNRVAYSYPMQVSLAQMNLFDSHDTDRVASMFVNPDRSYDGQNRLQDTGPNYDPRKPNREERARMKQAVINKMTFVGAPMIYYGTEAGMWSPDDPSDRMPMTWPGMKFVDPEVGFDQKFFDFYQHLIAIRSATPALRLGAFHPLLTDDRAGVIAYERMLGDDRAVVVINRSPRPRKIEVPFETQGQTYVDLIADGHSEAVFGKAAGENSDARPTLRIADDAEPVQASDDHLKLDLPAYGSAILVPVSR